MTLLTTGSKVAARLLGAKNSSYIIFSAIHASASKQARLKSFRQQHRSTVIGQITVDIVYSGMRGMKGESIFSVVFLLFYLVQTGSILKAILTNQIVKHEFNLQ
uniref:Uncharacterized protein n=1 Tax=Naja naja TaxID=35670 RepID=A0A8C6XBT7_NAJNA